MIYYLCGPDGFSLQATVRRLLRSALPDDAAELNTTRLAGADVTLDALRFACEAAPFLADRRAVVVDGLFARLGRGRARGGRGERAGPPPDGGRLSDEAAPREAEGGLGAAVTAYLPHVPAETLLIFVEPDAPPKAGPLASALAGAGAKQQYFPVLAGMPLVRWIRERAGSAGGEGRGEAGSRAGLPDGGGITRPAAELLADFVGGDLRTLANELDKLAAYAGPGQAIDVADVEALVSQVSEANVFACADAIGQGDRAGALGALHVLLEHGERPERILFMISRQVRLLLQARDRTQAGEGGEEVGRALGLSPYPLRKILDQMRLFRLDALEAMLRRVLEADLQIKTGQLEAGLSLDLLVADLCAAARAPQGRPGRADATRRPSPAGR